MTNRLYQLLRIRQDYINERANATEDNYRQSLDRCLENAAKLIEYENARNGNRAIRVYSESGSGRYATITCCYPDDNNRYAFMLVDKSKREPVDVYSGYSTVQLAEEQAHHNYPDFIS